MLTLVSAIATPILAPIAHAAPGDACPKVVIVALRGSGETNIGKSYYGDVETTGWEGATLSRLLGWTYYDSPDIADVPILDVDNSYEAIDVPTGAATNTFERSIASGITGATLTYDLFRKQISPDCAPQAILLGYSQGAAVARKVASSMESRGVITAVMTVGDPMQKPDADSVFGSGSNGSGIWRGYGDVQVGHDRFYSIPNLRRVSICHDKDPVCDAYVTSDPFAGPHKNYFDDDVKFQASSTLPPEAVDEIDFMANALRANIKVARDRYDAKLGSSRSPSDTVIAIDTTGSMGGLIASARTQADNLARRLLLNNAASRIALVEFRDHGDAFASRTAVDFTNNIGQIQDGLNRLVASGGGDWPEAVYSGIARSLSLPFAANAVRSVIVIGDAPAHDPEPVTGLTRADVTDALGGRVTLDFEAPGALPLGRQAPDSTADRDLGQSGPGIADASAARQTIVSTTAVTTPGTGQPVALYAIGTSGLIDSIEPIAIDSGGSAFDINSGIDFGEALGSAIDSIEASPKAVLDIEPTVPVGYPTQIGCGGSEGGSPPLTSSLTIDGQVFPCEIITTHTFVVPGNHDVALTVTDGKGRTSSTTVTVRAILPAPEVVVPGTGSATGLLGTGSAGGVSGR